MVTIENRVHCVEVELRKGDDFYRVLSFKKEDGTLFDLTGLAFRWDFFKDGTPIFSRYGADIEIDDNQVVLYLPSSLYDPLPFIGNYTHQFHETTQNQTIFDGRVAFLPGSGATSTPSYVYYGPAESSVVTSADVKSLAYAAFSSYSTITLPTGNESIKFIIALPQGVEIDTITDQTAINIQITDEYELQGQIMVEVGSVTVPYNIYEMNISVPYSVSHNHLISITHA